MKMKSFFKLGLILFSMLISQQIFAQKSNPILGGNLVLGGATGDFKNGYKSVTGLDGFIGTGGKNAFFILSTGYYSYKNQDGNSYGKIRMIPLKAGFRYYAAKKIFFTANAGLGLLKDETMSSSKSNFVYDAGIGYHGSFSNISLHYDGWKKRNTDGTSNTIQLRLGFALK